MVGDEDSDKTAISSTEVSLGMWTIIRTSTPFRLERVQCRPRRLAESQRSSTPAATDRFGPCDPRDRWQRGTAPAARCKNLPRRRAYLPASSHNRLDAQYETV